MGCAAAQRLNADRTTPRTEIGESRPDDSWLKHRKE
jgi:hypothetical protein